MANEGQAIAINQNAHQQILDYLQETRHPERDGVKRNVITTLDIGGAS